MKIMGCDFHPGYQQIAMLDLVTGEMVEKALSHEPCAAARCAQETRTRPSSADRAHGAASHPPASHQR